MKKIVWVAGLGAAMAASSLWACGGSTSSTTDNDGGPSSTTHADSGTTSTTHPDADTTGSTGPTTGGAQCVTSQASACGACFQQQCASAYSCEMANCADYAACTCACAAGDGNCIDACQSKQTAACMGCGDQGIACVTGPCASACGATVDAGLGSIGDASLDLDALFAPPTGTCVTLQNCCTSLSGLDLAACSFVVTLGGDDQTVCSQQLAAFQEGGMCK